MTREEAIAYFKDMNECTYGDVEPIQMAIKALGQESILDKIRAEIESLPKTYPFVNHIDTYVKEDDVKKIIDKYKGEISDGISKRNIKMWEEIFESENVEE